jgi:hypothetical protein
MAAAGLGGDSWRRLAATPAGVRDRVQGFARLCDPEACCAILLSSGTTGVPHGVMHSQRSLAANAVAAAEVFLDAPRDTRLSWLPLSHSLALTGELPFARSNSYATLFAHAQAPVPAASATDPALAPFDPVLRRAMAKAPGARYASVGEFAHALREALTPGSSLAEGAAPEKPA